MGTTRVAEARHRHCFSQSHKFVGACLSESNYENVCKTEGFPSGECKWHGIVSKCHRATASGSASRQSPHRRLAGSNPVSCTACSIAAA